MWRRSSPILNSSKSALELVGRAALIEAEYATVTFMKTAEEN